MSVKYLFVIQFRVGLGTSQKGGSVSERELRSRLIRTFLHAIAVILIAGSIQMIISKQSGAEFPLWTGVAIYLGASLASLFNDLGHRS